MATDPTTDPATPDESPTAPAAAGDVSVLADELLGPIEPAVSTHGLGVDASDPEAGTTAPGWVTLGEPGGPGGREPLVSPRKVLVLLAGGVAAALVIVGVLGTLAARQLAEREAVNDAATMAGVLAEAVVEPALTDGLMAGDPQAFAAFDRVARDQLLSTTIVRVKLWNADGKVLYADETQLIGRTFPLSDEQRSALAKPETVADVSDLESDENAFEDADRAVEVYRPVWGPSGQPALFELYASYDPVGERTTQLWRGFAGVTASSLVLLVVIVSPIVWALVRRLRRAEEQRIDLLQRAVDASADERRRIAASLHDGPVQELAATSFTVAGASATAAAHGQRALAKDLDAAAAAVRASIRSLRTLLVDIYPASLARSGIVAALHDLAQTTRRDGVVVHVDTADEDDLALSTDAQRLVHRVAQECLRNAAKHAGPATVTVSLHRDGPESATLDIVDDGVGFDVEQVRTAPREGHLGLHLLADAASVPGALLQVSSAPGRGTDWRLLLDGDARGRLVIRVLLVDDHQLVRAGVTTLLQSDPEITVVGEARNGREAVASVEGVGPDVVLMDLSMPEMDGVEATRAVLAKRPGTKVLVLTSFSDRQRVKEVLAAGAIGYVLKDSEPADLLAAVHAAARGRRADRPACRRRPAPGERRRPRRVRGGRRPLAARDRGAAPGRAGPRQQADRPRARHHRAHRQGPPRPGLPRDRRARPHQCRALGPRQPHRRLTPRPPPRAPRSPGIRPARGRRAAPAVAGLA